MSNEANMHPEDPLVVYEQTLGTSVQSWLKSGGDLDDFIFFDEPAWTCSER